MTLNKLLKDYSFPQEYTINDWNDLTYKEFGRFISNREVIDKYLPLLRTELVNLAQCEATTKGKQLLENIFNMLVSIIEKHFDSIIPNIKKSIIVLGETDKSWMTLSMIQPDLSDLNKQDKLIAKMNIYESMIETCYKYRLAFIFSVLKYDDDCIWDNIDNVDYKALMPKIAKYYTRSIISGISKYSSKEIPINQIRNIIAHKSYKIVKEEIEVTYGTSTKKTCNFSLEEFDAILTTINMNYKCMRLAEELIGFRYSKNLFNVTIDPSSIRFESKIVHTIHNLAIKGFKFDQYKSEGSVFILKLKKDSAKEQLLADTIHSSEQLLNIAVNIYEDEQMKDINKIVIEIYNLNGTYMASSSVDLSDAMKFAKANCSLDDYIEKIQFDLPK